MKTIVIFSGGMDSAVLLSHCIAEVGRENVEALSFNYGQRHSVELAHAERIAAAVGVPWQSVYVGNVFQLLAAGCSQLDRQVAVPHGHYAAESMKATVVPNRNMIMLSIAGGLCIARGGGRVAYGAHAGDHAIYPDCRPEFAEAVDVALSRADWKSCTLYRPFVDMTKANIVSRGVELGVDFGATWSCYEGGTRHCGKCGTCTERREAFSLAGVVDPTSYED